MLLLYTNSHLYWFHTTPIIERKNTNSKPGQRMFYTGYNILHFLVESFFDYPFQLPVKDKNNERYDYNQNFIVITCNSTPTIPKCMPFLVFTQKNKQTERKRTGRWNLVHLNDESKGKGIGRQGIWEMNSICWETNLSNNGRILKKNSSIFSLINPSPFFSFRYLSILQLFTHFSFCFLAKNHPLGFFTFLYVTSHSPIVFPSPLIKQLEGARQNARKKEHWSVFYQLVDFFGGYFVMNWNNPLFTLAK